MLRQKTLGRPPGGMQSRAGTQHIAGTVTRDEVKQHRTVQYRSRTCRGGDEVCDRQRGYHTWGDRHGWGEWVSHRSVADSQLRPPEGVFGFQTTRPQLWGQIQWNTNYWGETDNSVANFGGSSKQCALRGDCDK